MVRSFVTLLLFCSSLLAQSWAGFDVTLQLDFASADRLVGLYDGTEGQSRRVGELRGNRIAAATSLVLARRNASPELFLKELESFQAHFSSADDLFGLQETQNRISEVKLLLAECKRRQLDRRVLATIRQFFPENARVSITIPVFFVALGHENASAYVRRVVWNRDTPVFVGDEEGTPVIVVNLTRSAQHGGDLQSRFVELLSTLGHEAFHAVFGAYQSQSTIWQNLHARKTSAGVIAELVQNEGVAYYLSMQEVFGGSFPSQFILQLHKSMPALNAAMDELSDPRTTPQRSHELILNANLSGSMEKNYGAAAGLLMAYHIDTKLGRKFLAESLAAGPADFFRKYDEVVRHYADAPPLSPRLLRELQKEEEPR